jgi:hypothetical protein
MKLVVSALVSLLAGLLLGAIPFVNRHLHWNFFVIIPVSGLILGACFGWLQYQTARLLHARIGALGGVFLTLIGGASYLATDAGIWATSSVQTDTGQSVPLREVASLGEFMGERLSHSSISRRGRSIEVGSTVTIATFAVDVLGALLGTAALVFGMASGAAYCQRCSRYRKDLLKLEREYPLDEAESDAKWQAFEQLAEAKHYDELAARVQAMPQLTIASRRKLEAQESACPRCGQTAIALSVSRQDKDGWSSDGRQLNAECPVGVGAGARLTA